MKQLATQTKTQTGFPRVEFNDFLDTKCVLKASGLCHHIHPGVSAVWLGFRDTTPMVEASKAAALGIQTTQTTGMIPYPLPDDVELTADMLLNRNQVAALVNHLQLWLETGQFCEAEALDLASDYEDSIANLVWDENSIEVFNFEKEWQRVVPHLHKPEVEKRLLNQMNIYRGMRASLCRAEGDHNSHWEGCLAPETGPYLNDSTGRWYAKANELLDGAIERGEIDFEWPKDKSDEQAMEKARQKRFELIEPFEPKRDTLEWYQVPNEGYYLAPWLEELGRCIYPNLKWSIRFGDKHSFAYGADDAGSVKCIFDLLHFDKSVAELKKLAARRRPARLKYWTDKNLPMRPISTWPE